MPIDVGLTKPIANLYLHTIQKVANSHSSTCLGLQFEDS
jgi:hypothetical protein